MNILPGTNITNNIKLRNFYGKEKKIVGVKEFSNKNQKDTKISTLFTNQNKNKFKYQLHQINKTPDTKTHSINPNLTHESFYNQDNKMLSRILLQEKWDKSNNSTFNKYENTSSIAVKGLNDRKNKSNIYNNTNYNYSLYKNIKMKKIPISRPNEGSHFNSHNNINNNNINDMKKKIPQDNIKQKTNNIIISKKSFEIKKFDNNKINKNILKIINENEKKIKNYTNINSKNDINNDYINNDNNNPEIVFNNNIVKKTVIETKSSGSNIKSSLSDEDLDNIFLLNNVDIKKINNSFSLFESMNELNLNKKDEYIENNNKLLYLINNEKDYINENILCSTSNDYDNIIKDNLNNKIILSKKLLKLHERNWYNELKNISNEMKEKRGEIHLNNNFERYLKKIITIYEHFNWLIFSISNYYNLMFQRNDKLDINYFDDVDLPDVNSALWKRGFKWKGLYINIVPEINAKYIIKEIKALNYFFFDFIQIIIRYKEKANNQLSNDIIFPLLGYSKVNGMIIYVSVIINPDKSFNNNNIDFMNKFLDEIFNHNKGFVDYDLNNLNFNNNSKFYFHDSDSLTAEINEKIIKKRRLYELVGKLEKNYYVEDLLHSKLFTNMCEFHLIPIKGQKFILINL